MDHLMTFSFVHATTSALLHPHPCDFRSITNFGNSQQPKNNLELKPKLLVSPSLCYSAPFKKFRV